ncbi:MAG: mechanosensitive ion channel domain-containing protein [Bacteroidota bacterium]
MWRKIKPAGSFKLILIGLLAIFNFSRVLAQDAGSEAAVTDSVVTSVYEELEIGEISIKLSDINIKITGIEEKLISDNKLTHLKSENESFLSTINADLEEYSEKEIPVNDRRKLKNDLTFWEQHHQMIEARSSVISDYTNELDNRLSRLLKQEKELEFISELLTQGEYSDAIRGRLAEGIESLNRVKAKIEDKRNFLLALLDDDLVVDGLVVGRVDELKRIIETQKTDLFSSGQKPLSGIDYSEGNNWYAGGKVLKFAKNELANLKSYLSINIASFIFHILFTITLIFVFTYIHNKGNSVGHGKYSMYKKYFLEFLYTPISSGMIIGLFMSVFIYDNMPLILSDIFRFILVFPLMYTLLKIVHGRFYKYVYALGAVMIIQLIYEFIPTDKVVSRILLLLMGIIEIISVLHFIWLIKNKNLYRHRLLQKGMIFVAYIFLTMIVIGIGGNIIGYVSLSETLIYSVYGSVLVITLLVLTLIVVNGFLVFSFKGVLSEKIDAVRKNRDTLIDKTTRFVNIVFFLFVVHFLLRMIRLDGSVYEGLFDWLSKERSLGSVTFTTGGTILFILVIWISAVVSQVIRSVLENDVLKKMNLDKGLPHTISVMVRYAIITIGFFIALSVVGLPFSEFAIIFSAFGIGIGFGLQNIINNLVSGFILLVERPIKIGDTVEVGTMLGVVKSIGIRASKVRTFDGAEIIVPNGNLISSEVINWTLSDQNRRIELIVGVSYSSKPHQVHDILIKVLNEHKEVVSYPAPTVLFNELGASSLDFRMLFWVHDDYWVRVRSEIMFEVFDKLSEAGIEIPFPQQDLHLRSIDEGIVFKRSDEREKDKR